MLDSKLVSSDTSKMINLLELTICKESQQNLLVDVFSLHMYLIGAAQWFVITDHYLPHESGLHMYMYMSSPIPLSFWYVEKIMVNVIWSRLCIVLYLFLHSHVHTGNMWLWQQLNAFTLDTPTLFVVACSKSFNMFYSCIYKYTYYTSTCNAECPTDYTILIYR